MTFSISKPDAIVRGKIRLDGSKSISNRALLIRALCQNQFSIENLAHSADTETMVRLLNQKGGHFDVGPAGTTFRFLTGYLALQDGEQILTGSSRMLQRPIGPLVDALNTIGADIQYMDKKGYPPIRIRSPRDLGKVNTLSIPANISSQFISALLMIAPTLPRGLQITLHGDLVSESYLQMTIEMMRDFGIEVSYHKNKISVANQLYQGRDYAVESDWSAASYHFANAALSQDCSLLLQGLFQNSMQGDSVLPTLFQKLGVRSTWTNDGMLLQKANKPDPFFEHDFIKCPDIAQTVSVVCGALGVKALFAGLETLSIKETDRIDALKKELSKINVNFCLVENKNTLPSGKQLYMVEGKAKWASPPLFETYHDHRMAMALAPLSIIAPIRILDPVVVNKSYPYFWKDLIKLGWKVELETQSKDIFK